MAPRGTTWAMPTWSAMPTKSLRRSRISRIMRLRPPTRRRLLRMPLPQRKTRRAQQTVRRALRAPRSPPPTWRTLPRRARRQRQVRPRMRPTRQTPPPKAPRRPLAMRKHWRTQPMLRPMRPSPTRLRPRRTLRMRRPPPRTLRAWPRRRRPPQTARPSPPPTRPPPQGRRIRLLPPPLAWQTARPTC